MKQKLKSFLKTAVQFVLNPRLLLCFGMGWMITNGWSYVLLGLGTWLENEWMIAVASAYLAFLWLPVSPEKIVTVAIAITLLRWLFPNDKKTLGILKKTHEELKQAFRLKKQQRQEKKHKK
jgi:hypothetical protein